MYFVVKLDSEKTMAIINIWWIHGPPIVFPRTMPLRSDHYKKINTTSSFSAFLYLVFKSHFNILGHAVDPTVVEPVTLLFSDLVGFTATCSSLTPYEVISMLNDLYTKFDTACDIIDVYKVIIFFVILCTFNVSCFMCFED